MQNILTYRILKLHTNTPTMYLCDFVVGLNHFNEFVSASTTPSTRWGQGRAPLQPTLHFRFYVSQSPVRRQKPHKSFEQGKLDEKFLTRKSS